MNFDQFKNTVEYPDRPGKPVLPKCATPADYRKYAQDLEQHAARLEEYKKSSDAWHKEQGRLDDLAKQAMLEDVGLAKHPKRDKIYAYAWEQGHSGGYNDVWCVLSDIADLFKD